MNAAAAYNKAETIGNQMVAFWASYAGRTINKMEEFSMLVEWHDAINAAIEAALAVRDWKSDEELCAMRAECEMWLDHSQAA